MDKPELLKQLRIVFIEELHECVGDMHRHLQSLEQNSEPQVREMLKNELYRAAHKMKGAANAAQVADVEKLCRQMQYILISIRDGHRTMDDKLHAQFLDAVRYLTASEGLLRDGKTPESGDAIFD